MRPVIAAGTRDHQPTSARLFHKPRCGWLRSVVFKLVRSVEHRDLTKLFTLDFFQTVCRARTMAGRRASCGFLVRKEQKPLLITWQQMRASDSQLPIPFISSGHQIHQSFKASGSVVITPARSRARHSSGNQGIPVQAGAEILWNSRIPALCPSYSQASARE